MITSTYIYIRYLRDPRFGPCLAVDLVEGVSSWSS